MAKRIAEICFFVVLALISVLITEAAYRLYLRHNLNSAVAAKVATALDPAPTFYFYTYPAPWRFDRELGFAFNDGDWQGGHFLKGEFMGCGVYGRGNRYGNFSVVRGDYPSAEVKILFFGSSYTLMDEERTGDTATNILQGILSKELGKSVHILNYSRDSIGVMTMFDMARARIPIDKPDLVIFGFNTLGLIYQRNWRFIKESRPGFYRMYQTMAASDEIIKDRAVLNLQVVSSRTTKAWCDKIGQAIAAGDKHSVRNDPLIVDLIREYNSVKQDQVRPMIAVDFLTMKKSFIYNLIRHRNPYQGIDVYEPQTIYAPLSINSFFEDKDFINTVAEIKTLGVPLRLVHLPALADLKKPGTIAYGAYGVAAEREQSLTSSLEQITGERYVPITRYYRSRDLANPLELVLSEQDSHPNARGTRLMAEALARFLLERGWGSIPPHAGAVDEKPN
ncbi:MAG: hypothetical protein IT562_15695 [Alphaproteobacteria bacterium]|nr:hypothetical protein [Alphaproteobacteria bacterium]